MHAHSAHVQSQNTQSMGSKSKWYSRIECSAHLLSKSKGTFFSRIEMFVHIVFKIGACRLNCKK